MGSKKNSRSPENQSSTEDIEASQQETVSPEMLEVQQKQKSAALNVSALLENDEDAEFFAQRDKIIEIAERMIREIGTLRHPRRDLLDQFVPPENSEHFFDQEYKKMWEFFERFHNKEAVAILQEGIVQAIKENENIEPYHWDHHELRRLLNKTNEDIYA